MREASRDVVHECSTSRRERQSNMSNSKMDPCSIHVGWLHDKDCSITESHLRSHFRVSSSFFFFFFFLFSFDGDLKTLRTNKEQLREREREKGSRSFAT